MHPLLIASIFVVAMASPAVVALKYAAKPKRELALEAGSARRLPRTDEGSLVLPPRVPEYIALTPRLRLLESATLINQLPMSASVDQAEDGIRVSQEGRENVMA